MIRFILLILLICLAIDDSYLLSSSLDFKRHQEDPNNLKKALENILRVSVKPIVKGINKNSLCNGFVFEAKEMLIFIKMNCISRSDLKFIGEIQSLKTIFDTQTVPVPYPIATGYTDKYVHFFIVMEYVNMTSLDAQGSAVLGSHLADMHLHNLKQNKNKNSTVKQFGFKIKTKCGSMFQNNTWTNDWITFFTENRMEYQINLLNKTKKSSLVKKVVEDYWPRLKPMIPKFFNGINVEPSLLHGDLIPNNVAQVNSTEPVIFDPCSFYGHHEYDIAATTLFDGFKQEFFDAYFKKIPKAEGFENRMKLYHLYQHLTSWNEYGNYYRSSTSETFKQLLNLYQ